MNEKYSQRQFSTLTGIARATLQLWAKNGKLTPAIEINGKKFYSDAQKEIALRLYSSKNTSPTATDVPEQNAGNLTETALAASNSRLKAFREVAQNEKVTNGQPDDDSREVDSENQLTSNVVSCEGTAAENDSETFAPMSAGEEIVAPVAEIKPLELRNLDSAIPTDTKYLEDFVFEPLGEKSLEELVYETRYFTVNAFKHLVGAGLRLIELQKRVEQGNWIKWLDDNVSISYRKAANLMAIAKKFGQDVKTFSHLGYSQIVALLPLSVEHAKDFLKEQEEKGTPPDMQTQKEFESDLKHFKQRKLKPAPNDEDAQEEPPSKYFNLLGKSTVQAVVDELNNKATAPDEPSANAPEPPEPTPETTTQSQSQSATQDNEATAKKYADLIIDKEFSTILPPLKDYEFKGLEEHILRFGILCPLLVWNGILLDGHARYEIAKRHNLPFKTLEVTTINDRHDAILFIVQNQLCRKHLIEVERVKMVIDCEKILQELVSGGDSND